MYELIYGNINYSSWSIRPMVLMRHFNIEYKPHFISLFDDEWYRAGKNSLKPSLTLPMLVVSNGDNSIRIWDSLAIIEFLAEQHKDLAIWPIDMDARAVARSIAAEMHSSFTTFRNIHPMNIRVKLKNFKKPYEAQNDIDRIITLWKLAKDEYGSGGDYLFGEFCATDAMFAPVIFRLVNYGVDLPQFAQDYCNAMLENDAMKSIIKDAHDENISISKYEEYLTPYK